VRTAKVQQLPIRNIIFTPPNLRGAADSPIIEDVDKSREFHEAPSENDPCGDE
jgi:hypothetical protein